MDSDREIVRMVSGMGWLGEFAVIWSIGMWDKHNR